MLRCFRIDFGDSMSVGYFTLVEGCRPLRLMVVWELRDKGRDRQKACLELSRSEKSIRSTVNAVKRAPRLPCPHGVQS